MANAEIPVKHKDYAAWRRVSRTMPHGGECHIEDPQDSRCFQSGSDVDSA